MAGPIKHTNKMNNTEYKHLKKIWLNNHATIGEIDLMRSAVNWANARDETLNEYKTIDKLIREFIQDTYC